MGDHMKTTLNIDEAVFAELKREAARQGRTMSELVEMALRLMLSSQRKRRAALPDLPKRLIPLTPGLRNMVTCGAPWHKNK